MSGDPAELQTQGYGEFSADDLSLLREVYQTVRLERLDSQGTDPYIREILNRLDRVGGSPIGLSELDIVVNRALSQNMAEPDAKLETITEEAETLCAWLPVPKPAPSLPDQIPGVLGEFVEYVLSSAPFPEPSYATQSALALGSVVLGRRYRTSESNWPVLYLLAVGASGSGKEHGRSCIRRALLAAGGEAESRLGFRSYTSAAGIAAALRRRPVHLSIIDEFGDMIALSRDAGQGYKRQALSTLRELWGFGGDADGGSLSPQAYADASMKPIEQDREQAIERPALSVWGLTTPRQFYEALDGGDIENGLANRLLTAVSEQEFTKRQKRRNGKLPESVIDWIRYYVPEPGSLVDVQGADCPPDPVTIPFSKKALRVLDFFEDDVLAKRQYLAAREGELAPIWARAVEQSMRVALIVSQSARESKISQASMQWSINYVRHSTEQLESVVRRHVGDNDTEIQLRQLRGVIEEYGPRGVSRSDLARKAPLRKHTASKRNELLASLVDSGEVHAVKIKRGRHVSRRYRAGSLGPWKSDEGGESDD